MIKFEVTKGYRKNNPFHWFGFGFGSGFIRPAPGTWGTFAAIPWWYTFTAFEGAGYFVFTVLFSLCGILVCHIASKHIEEDGGEHDHSSIVFDEWSGLLVTMLFLPATWNALVVGFVLFRIFDAVKRGPVGWIDKNVSGGLGIMSDDWLAGIIAGLCGLFILWIEPEPVTKLLELIGTPF